MQKFEYVVLQTQAGRVTFVNGDWLGSRPLQAENQNECLQSCPWVWEYLQVLGNDGWDLISAAQIGMNLSGVISPDTPPLQEGEIIVPGMYRFNAGVDQQSQLIYLKRSV